MRNIKHEKSITLNYSRQTPNGGGWRWLFWTPNLLSTSPPLPFACSLFPRNFRFVTFIITNSRENNLSLLEILRKFCKIVWQTSEIPRSKTKTHANSTWFSFFLIPLENQPLFFFTSGISTHFFFNIHGNSMKFHLEFPGIAYYFSWWLLSSSYDLPYTINTMCTYTIC